jgi:mRNA interferase RelE/StbE
MTPSPYSVTLRPAARRALRAVTSAVQTRIVARLEQLAGDPFAGDITKLRGPTGEFRTRVGDYRIVYLIDTVAREVTVTRIGHRREVYDR